MGQPPDLQRHLLRADQSAKRQEQLQGIIPDLIINALYLEHLEEGAYAHFGDATTLGDVKTLAQGQAYSEPPSTAFGASAQKRAGKVHGDYPKLPRSSTQNPARTRTLLGPSRQR